MNKLKRIQVEGFKSIRSLDLELGPINVLIGANGSGKSNFISVFKMLSAMTKGELQLYVGKTGGANSILYYGSKTTEQLRIRLEMETTHSTDIHNYQIYDFSLSGAAGDTLIFAKENATLNGGGLDRSIDIHFDLGHKESKTLLVDVSNDPVWFHWFHRWKKVQVFQFHDTSDQSPIRKEGNIDTHYVLRHDGGNLAAYLYMLQETYPSNYRRIVNTIRLVAPHFGDFVLRPSRLNPNNIKLNWKEKEIDDLFDPHQLPDGLLRAMALVTLLLSPKEKGVDFGEPDVIIIDEPELGLHPAAIEILGALIREASLNCQIIVATQSTNLVDQFKPEDVIVADRRKVQGREEYETVIYRPEIGKLESWLKDYTLSELWDKNIIGGRPGG